MSRGARSTRAVLLALCALLAGCGSKTAPWWLADGGAGDADADGDGDSDADSDADTDADSDSDVDPILDSDGDYLSDGFEAELGTDPLDPDTDGDGATDFVEWYAGTDPADPGSSPRALGVFYFLIPYGGATIPQLDTFVFSTTVRFADVFFAMDTTGSMNGEITQLKSTLSSTIVPGLQAAIEEVRFGVGFVDDFPTGDYGTDGIDSVFGLLQAMTSDVGLAQDGVDLLALHGGNDWAEGQVPALWAIATGGGLGGFLPEQDGCPEGAFGYPCFRPGAMPIVVLMTDAPFHGGPDGYDPYGDDLGFDPPTYAEAVDALAGIGARVVTVYSGPAEDLGQAHCEALSLDTGAVVDGEPLTFPIAATGAGLDTAVVDGVNALVTAVPLDIKASARDDDGDDVDATHFIASVAPDEEGGFADPADPTVVCVGGMDAVDTDAQPGDDTFLDVPPGAPVCFEILPTPQNDLVPMVTDPQLFTAFVDVYGEQTALLDTRALFFLVPPSVPIH